MHSPERIRLCTSNSCNGLNRDFSHMLGMVLIAAFTMFLAACHSGPTVTKVVYKSVLKESGVIVIWTPEPTGEIMPRLTPDLSGTPSETIATRENIQRLLQGQEWQDPISLAFPDAPEDIVRLDAEQEQKVLKLHMEILRKLDEGIEFEPLCVGSCLRSSSRMSGDQSLENRPANGGEAGNSDNFGQGVEETTLNTPKARERIRKAIKAMEEEVCEGNLTGTVCISSGGNGTFEATCGNRSVKILQRPDRPWSALLTFYEDDATEKHRPQSKWILRSPRASTPASTSH